MLGCFILHGLGASLVAAKDAHQPLPAYAAVTPKPYPLAWSIPSQHPLIGLIWSQSERGPVDRVHLSAAILAADFALVGEVHDNADGHRIQAEAISPASLSGRARAVVFEQMRADQAPALATFQALRKTVPANADVAELKRLLDWDKSGWAKDGYDPLFDAVIKANLPIYAGDPARETIKKVAKEGASALPQDELTRLGLDKPLPDAAQEDLLDQLEKSHCGVMPKSAFGNLSFAQRLRDATQADVVLKAARDNSRAILFAGNGHVRKDRGVPYYLKQRAPDKKVVSVMLVEVEDGKTDPESYVERGPDGQPTADYIVFTPRAERSDPCEEMKKRVYKPDK